MIASLDYSRILSYAAKASSLSISSGGLCGSEAKRWNFTLCGDGVSSSSASVMASPPARQSAALEKFAEITGWQGSSCRTFWRQAGETTLAYR
ncbi:hypothetical protein [Chthoniobacter flavus]|nr:hypothetical protein [Chthoniobacter flavus]